MPSSSPFASTNRDPVGSVDLSSCILLLTAFYVDNGKNLPVWQRLPQLAYWLLPRTVGLPLVARALARYRGLATRRPTPTP